MNEEVARLLSWPSHEAEQSMSRNKNNPFFMRSPRYARDNTCVFNFINKEEE